jgi:hypothetical protein
MCRFSDDPVKIIKYIESLVIMTVTLFAGLLESKEPATRDHIRLIAPHVGQNWRDVGRTLNLTDGRLEQIEQDYRGERMKEVFEAFACMM